MKGAVCEDILHEAASDALFLLDCCHSAGYASRPLRGFSETIAASGFESIAPPPGPHSFTATLRRVLESWALKSAAFSVANLHTEILVSLKELPPQHIQEGISFEWRRTPVHYFRSSNVCPQSIVLSPLPAASTEAVPFFTLREMGEERSVSQPRVILKITLVQDYPETDSADACHRWLASFPLPTADIKVEAVYRSFSTVVLISLSVAAWDLLPEIPGCSFVCFTTSENLAIWRSPTHPMVARWIEKVRHELETSEAPDKPWAEPWGSAADQSSTLFSSPAASVWGGPGPHPQALRDVWTKEQDDILLAKRESGKTYEAIAKEMSAECGVIVTPNMMVKRRFQILDARHDVSLIQKLNLEFTALITFLLGGRTRIERLY